jgi:hypothetical protein
MEEWYVEDGGLSFGPYTLTEVFDLIDNNSVSQAALFTSSGVRANAEQLRTHWPDPRSASPAPVPPAPPPLPPAPPTAAVPEEMPVVSAPQPAGGAIDVTPPVLERDAILLLGRRRSGKTVYLATLYSLLWKSLHGMNMKALSGQAHQMLMGIVDQLKHSQWPEATLGSRQLEFEITYHRRKYILIACDYSGEDFKRAFVSEEVDSPEVQALLRYVDRAAAVILLIDPAVAVEGKVDELVDDDFGMVQAVERIRNWYGGEEVPVVLVLTKADRNKKLIQGVGSGKEFVLRHYPALVRTLKSMAIFQVSAAQESKDDKGHTRPRSDSLPVNVENPLLWCVREIHQRKKRQRGEAERKRREEAASRRQREQEEAERRFNRRFAAGVTVFFILVLCVLAVVYFLTTY